MRTRHLPPAEWGRLVGTELAPVLHDLSPDWCQVLVVEDEDGQIIGCWALVTMRHVEGLWIAPEHRQSGSVARRLLGGMAHLAREQNISTVLTSSIDPVVTDYLRRLDAKEMPGQHFLWHMTKKPSILQEPTCPPL